MDGLSAASVDGTSTRFEPPDTSNHSLLELTDARSIEDVLKCCVHVKPAIEVFSAGMHHYSVAVRRREHTQLQSTIAFSTDDFACLDGDCTLRFSLYGVIFVLNGRLRQLNDGVAVCTPQGLFCMDRRVVARLNLSPGRAELVWSCLESGELQLTSGSVRDLTPQGIGLVLDRSDGHFPNKTFAATMRVGDTMIHCLAKKQRVAIGPGQTVGLTITPASGVRTLAQVYLRERHPRLTPRHLVAQDDMRTLMQDSGYLSLRSTAAQFAAWHENQPTNLISSDSVYRAVDGTILGHVSATQIYRRTWLWHQLACIAGHAESGESRLSLYAMAASVPSVYHGTTACALAYFNQAHRWHQVFFQQFVAWLNDPSLATICSFDRFERELPPEDFEAPGCEVRHARSDHELVQAATLVRAHLPEVTADALDIHPGELQRAPEQLRDRGREVLMLYEHGELVGVALCDLGDPDLSLFNLFNMGQLYVRTGRLTPSSQAQRMLAAKVRHIYATHGIERSMLVAPADTLEHSVEPDTRWVERMGCLVIADRGLRQFENFCRFHFGRRWRRHASSNTTGERS